MRNYTSRHVILSVEIYAAFLYTEFCTCTLRIHEYSKVTRTITEVFMATLRILLGLQIHSAMHGRYHYSVYKNIRRIIIYVISPKKLSENSNLSVNQDYDRLYIQFLYKEEHYLDP